MKIIELESLFRLGLFNRFGLALVGYNTSKQGSN